MRRGLVVNVALALASSASSSSRSSRAAARLLEKPRPPRREVADYIWDWDDKMPGGFYVMKSDGVGWPPWEEFNRDGLRDRTRTREKPEGFRRIAILGDSVTLGAEIRPEEAYPQRLEARFRAEGRRVEVMNVALWGWSTRQERIAWQRIARAYQPDQAILAVCLNDIPELFNNLSRPPRWLDAPARALGARAPRWWTPRAARSTAWSASSPSPTPRACGRRWTASSRRCARCAGRSRRTGPPSPSSSSRSASRSEPGAPPPVVQQRIAAFCASEGLRCLDLLPTLGRVGPSAFVDYDHLSPAGASLVADTLYASGLLVRGDSAADVLREALGDRAADVAALAVGAGERASTGVRAECAAALGALGPGGAGRGAGRSSPRSRTRARRCAPPRPGRCARIGPGAEDVPRLVAALGSADGYVVAFAAWSLGNLGSAAQAAVPDLARALARDDTNAVVAGALARIGPAAAAAVRRPRRGAAQRRRRPPLAGGADARADRPAGRVGRAVAHGGAVRPEQPVRLHAARALGRIGPAARPAAAALQRATGRPRTRAGAGARGARRPSEPADD